MNLKKREDHYIEKFIIFWTKRTNQVCTNDDIKIMAFLEALQPKYVVQYFDYCKLPLDEFLQALFKRNNSI